MSGFVHRLTLAAVGVSLCVVPTGAIAASPEPTVQPAAAVPTVDAWLALSAMTTGSSSASAAAAAAQDDDDDDDRVGFPPWSSLGVIVATIGVAIYILLKDHNHDIELPLSPA